MLLGVLDADRIANESAGFEEIVTYPVMFNFLSLAEFFSNFRCYEFIIFIIMHELFCFK